MTTNKNWEERFDEKFKMYDGHMTDSCPAFVGNGRCDCVVFDVEDIEIKSFIQTELTTAKAEERERIVEVLEGELNIQKKVEEKAKQVFVIGWKKVRQMSEDRDIRNGKIETLAEAITKIKGEA